MLGGCAATAWLVVRTWLGWLDGAPRVLALATWTTAALIFVHVVPGAFGALVPEAAVAATAVALTAVASRARRKGPHTRQQRRQVRVPDLRGLAAAVPDGRGSLALAVGAAIAVSGCALALLRDIAGTPILSIDALNFQVPIVARWLQQDSIWGLHQFIADYSNATYPHNGNVLVAAVMAPFDSAFLARLVPVPYWALTGVATYALARELGSPRAAAGLAGAALLAMPVSIGAGLEGVQTDFPMLAMLGAGVLFLVRRRSTAELVTAAVALGLAFGTKWYALTAVAAIGAVWLLARPRPRHVAALTGLIVLAGGFWLVRNWIEAGNPLFPQPLEPFFDAPPDPLREAGGFTLVHYATDFGVWDEYLRPAFAASFGWAAVLFAFGALAATVTRLRSQISDRRVLLVAVGTAVLAVLYLVTPYSAFGPEGRPVLAQASTRYALPALIGAAALTAWLAGRGGRAKAAVEILLAAVVVDGLRRGFTLPAGKVVLGVVLASAVAAAAWKWPRSRAGAAAALAAVAAGAIAVAVVSRQRSETQTYGQLDPVLAALPRSGASIGLAGQWAPRDIAPPLPAFGPRLGNEVRYVGRFEDHMLRPFRDQRAFTAALGGLDLVIVGKAEAAPGDGWLRAAHWRQIGESQRFLLYAPPSG